MPTSIAEINAQLLELRDERRRAEDQLRKVQTVIRGLYRKRHELLREEAMQGRGAVVSPTIAEMELFV
jgi:hypothetical protein